MGGTFGGPDSSEWPDWWFEAVSLCEQQKVIEHNARTEHEIEQSKRK